MFGVIYQSITAPMDVIGKDELEHRKEAALFLPLLASVLGAAVIPILSHFSRDPQVAAGLGIGSMALALIVSVATWLCIGGVLWLTAKSFGRELTFARLASAWGLSYSPNILCMLLYGVLLLFPGLWQGSEVVSFILGTLFVLCLVWKAIYYFMIVRLVFQASLGEFFKLTGIAAVAFVLLAFLGAKAGLRVPML